MKKMDRGAMYYAVSDQNDTVCVRWNDNSVVTILSNEYGVNPLQKCVRCSAKEKKKIEIPQPNVIKRDNQYMGDVDQLDNNVSNYRIAFRGKKWYTSIIYWLFDLCVTNAWSLARFYGVKKDNLEFRRDVVRALLTKYGNKTTVVGRKRAAIIHPSIATGHLIITGQPRRRCQLCKNKTTKKCEACDVRLHDKCFTIFHS
ncbi:hypothetical protein NQ314_012738 [Rhamnusium bicolor]|uniref:PiggyBac transposable element-derived protein domain-containing protein n=1 Tax=Rhamnusium bicolor TaxID=1586634 RepID=A0AAV8X9E9_9CUCU|nr:hypothetical protein NQ314_012738 [Rhamnusium bicolor]